MTNGRSSVVSTPAVFRFVSIALVGCAVASSALAGAALKQPEQQGVTFAPHRAIYELSIDSTSSGSGVSGIGGRIVYELTGSACEGFTQNMRFVTVTSNSEGGSQTTDLRTSSWEQFPADKLRFSSSTYQDDQLAEQARGVAQRSNTQDGLEVELAKPEKKTFKVAAPVYFPMQHSAALIEAARKGKSHFGADIYDGTDNGAKVYTTSALIGPRVAPGAQSIKSLAGQKSGTTLDGTLSWPVSISYFAQTEPGKAKHKDEIPLYEMSYRFHENGVTSNLRLDYGEYALKGELKELSFIDPNPCPAGKP